MCRKLQVGLLISLFCLISLGTVVGITQKLFNSGKISQVLGEETKCKEKGYCKSDQECCSGECKRINYFSRISYFKKKGYIGMCTRATKPRPKPTTTPKPQSNCVDCKQLTILKGEIASLLKKVERLEQACMKKIPPKPTTAPKPRTPTSTPTRKPTKTPSPAPTDGPPPPPAP